MLSDNKRYGEKVTKQRRVIKSVGWGVGGYILKFHFKNISKILI